MFYQIFQLLDQINSFFWGYLGFVIVITLGGYFTIKTGFFQIRVLPVVFKTFIQFLKKSPTQQAGTHPLRVFCASSGGMIGVGNVVGIIAALQLGGPGALFWVWMAAFFGMLIKYSEVYLGLRFRVANKNNGYDGGPMFYVGKAFDAAWIPGVICVLICIYGAEVYQFNVVVETISTNWSIDKIIVIPTLLTLVMYACLGGVPRVAKICSLLMPIMIISYIVMGFWVISHHIDQLPQIFVLVFKSAFNGHAAIGGFAGGTMILAIQNGMAGACYSADIGIGYDSIIQSESRTIHPERQARMALLGVCVDNLICTLSILLVLTSGILESPDYLPGTNLVQLALESYIPQISTIMPIFLFIVAYTTLIAYLSVGLKCARYLHPKLGQTVYFVYAGISLILFSFLDQSYALLVMRFSGVLLLMINIVGIYKLRKEIAFVSHDDYDEKVPTFAVSNTV
jgi:alanine or glycine:cation symporter, AGCS family